ncbi:RNA polymerase sigma factor [Zobellia roscoffensis]|uniref:RNA polymerase sigma factor n=1 Tax=Zobellia roscoffensis TaxID=2779508 RepID=UPI00188C6801|nr:sigma-70 family RNA polymerase sigma factor [Zobellia roscoffensis]
MSIIKKLVVGDKVAFEKFYFDTHSKLYAFALKRTNNKALSIEIVQEAYITLWSKKHTIDPFREKFESYLFSCIRNAIIQEYKRKLREQEAAIHFSEARLANEAPEIQDKFSSRTLITLLESLPYRQKEVIDLVKLQGYSYRQAATILGISERTVETHLRSAIKNLRSKSDHLALYVFLFTLA